MLIQSLETKRVIAEYTRNQLEEDFANNQRICRPIYSCQE